MHRIGIIGAGEISHRHIERIRRIPDFEFSGLLDINRDHTNPDSVINAFPTFNSLEELIEKSDIVDIAGRHIPHFNLASQALRRSRHVFIDRPLMGSLMEMQKLTKLAFEADVKVQIGHAERYNPAFTLVRDYIDQPGYIEARRSMPLDANHQDIDVVMDMMIHDIDIILSLVDSGIKRIKARGHSLDGQKLSMVHAHIEFDNGCIANLNSSKMAGGEEALLQIYQAERSFVLDLKHGRVEQILYNTTNGREERNVLRVDKNAFDPLRSGLESLRRAITDNTAPYVSLIDGSNALEVAFTILDKVAHWQGMNG